MKDIMNQEEFNASINDLAIETEKLLHNRSQNIKWRVIGITEGFDARLKVDARYKEYNYRREFGFDFDRQPFDYTKIVNVILDLTIENLALQIFSPKFVETNEQL